MRFSFIDGLLLLHLLQYNLNNALIISGISIPHAKSTTITKYFENLVFPADWPYSTSDLTPIDSLDDQMFYLMPKFVHHAADDSRAALTKYYSCILQSSKNNAVLDLCSSFTSHYPPDWKASRCVAIGLNPFELMANPSKTEWTIQNLNTNPKLPYEDCTFDTITNSLSVDYMTRPIELFKECYRVLKPGGLAAMAFTNRCFPTKIVPIWAEPFTDRNHVKIVMNYFHFSDSWEELALVDVSPSLRDPMYIVQAKKPAIN